MKNISQEDVSKDLNKPNTRYNSHALLKNRKAETIYVYKRDLPINQR